MSNNEYPRYKPEEVETILSLYRSLFDEKIFPKEYYFAQERKYNLLQTNFFDRNVNAKNIEEASKRAFHILSNYSEDTMSKIKDFCRKNNNETEIEFEENLCVELKVAYKSFHKIGSSIGLNPYLDHSLLFCNQKKIRGPKSIIVFLFNDFYPIFYKSRKYRRTSLKDPFEQFSLFEGYIKFTKDFKEKIKSLAGNNIIMFLNIYPDFRSPSSPTSGYDPFRELTYRDCRDGFVKLICSINPDFRVRKVLCFGDVVRETMMLRTTKFYQDWKKPYEIDDLEAKFYFFYHPSYKGFKVQKQEKDILEILGL